MHGTAQREDNSGSGDPVKRLHRKTRDGGYFNWRCSSEDACVKTISKPLLEMELIRPANGLIQEFKKKKEETRVNPSALYWER